MFLICNGKYKKRIGNTNISDIIFEMDRSLIWFVLCLNRIELNMFYVK